MTTPPKQLLIEGERVDLLGEAIGQFERKQWPDGTWTFDVNLEPRLANPFVRAMMRVEARLLLEDADRFLLPDTDHRTDDQRRLDALIALVTAVGKVWRTPPDSLRSHQASP